jgi:hypothetical protein
MDHDEIGATRRRRHRRKLAPSSSLDVLTRSESDRAALIGRLSQRADAEWLAELLIDLEEDEVPRLHLVEALRRVSR